MERNQIHKNQKGYSMWKGKLLKFLKKRNFTLSDIATKIKPDTLEEKTRICAYGARKVYLLRAVILSAICRCCSVRPCIIIMFSYCLHVFSGGFGKVRAVFFERRQSACFYNNRRESATFRRWQPAVAG